MAYQEHPMLPRDLKDYQAPTIWRLHRDKAWMAVAVALWVWAMMIPQDTEASKPVPEIVATTIPQDLYCPRMRDGLPFRLMVKQRNYLGYEWHQCYYGAIQRRDIF